MPLGSAGLAERLLPDKLLQPSDEGDRGSPRAQPQKERPGAPFQKMTLRIQQLKKHPGIMSLFVFIGFGIGSGLFTLVRTYVFSPEVSWNKNNNPEPWNKFGPTDQYKLVSVTTDYKNLKKDRPDY